MSVSHLAELPAQTLRALQFPLQSMQMIYWTMSVQNGPCPIGQHPQYKQEKCTPFQGRRGSQWRWNVSLHHIFIMVNSAQILRITMIISLLTKGTLMSFDVAASVYQDGYSTCLQGQYLLTLLKLLYVQIIIRTYLVNNRILLCFHYTFKIKIRI